MDHSTISLAAVRLMSRLVSAFRSDTFFSLRGNTYMTSALGGEGGTQKEDEVKEVV